jgi:hypothetical protein
MAVARLQGACRTAFYALLSLLRRNVWSRWDRDGRTLSRLI